jgi:hypothetical protein
MLVTEVLRRGDSASGVDPSDRAEIDLFTASLLKELGLGPCRVVEGHGRRSIRYGPFVVVRCMGCCIARRLEGA